MKPHHLPEELRAESRKKCSRPFRRKIRPSLNQKSGEHFFAGHASGASGGGAIHSFSDFENRCELGKIETPKTKQKPLAFQRFLFTEKLIIETPGVVSIMRDGINDTYDETNTEHLMAHRNRNNVLDHQ